MGITEKFQNSEKPPAAPAKNETGTIERHTIAEILKNDNESRLFGTYLHYQGKGELADKIYVTGI